MQQFLDTVELQKNYLSKRDELCKGILVSPALLYVASQLEEEIELERREKKKRVVEDKFAMGIEHDNEISTSLDKTSVNLGPVSAILIYWKYRIF